MKLRLTSLATLVAAATAALGAPAGQAQSSADLVRLPLPRYDGTLTPYTFELAYPVMTLIYDTLLWRDEDGVPRPWLARSVDRAGGGRRVTIRLRDGVRWHDGRPLTAADVAFTFDFVRQRYHPRFTPQLSDVQRVEASDRLTVTIDLRRPSLGFSDQPLADLPILPRHLWQGLRGNAVPSGRTVGSGPYRLRRAHPSGGYELSANRSYFRGPPRVARIRMPIIRREDRTYQALRRRRVDMLPIGLPEDAADRLGGAFGINLKSGELYSGAALLLNLRRPPFNDAAARRAAARAIDLRRVVRNVGPATPADRGYIHPSSRWAAGGALHRFDAGAARATMARLGRPAVRVLAPENDPVKAEAGRQVVLALRRAGARATLGKVPRAVLGQAVGEDGSSPAFDAAIVDVPPLASYDPDFLARVFGSGSRTAPLNYAGYSSKAFVSLANRVATAPDRASRLRAVRAELRLLARDAPVVPLVFPEGNFAYRPAIYDGWAYTKGAGILDKRSFLAGGGSAEGADDDAAGGDTEDDDGTGVLDVLRYGSLVVLAVVLVLAATALLRRRSLERR